jgi:hypothetical protein
MAATMPVLAGTLLLQALAPSVRWFGRGFVYFMAPLV